MKKLFSVLTMSVCMLSLCSCGQNNISSDIAANRENSVPSVGTPAQSEKNSLDSDTAEKTEKIYILGDSYSTFEGCIPEGFAAWYTNGGNGQNNVTDKSMTWWQILLDNKNFSLFKNNSFSGTTICNTGYNGDYCPDTSFVGRFTADVENGVFKDEQPDKIIVFGGTNDSWANSPIGELKQSAFTDDDLKEVLPAFCYLLLQIKDTLPNSEIIVIVNTELKSEITFGLLNACVSQDVKYVKLRDISKQAGHPDTDGMRQIYEQLCTVLES